MHCSADALGGFPSLVQLHLYALVTSTGAIVAVYALHAFKQMDRHENANPWSHGGMLCTDLKIKISTMQDPDPESASGYITDKAPANC